MSLYLLIGAGGLFACLFALNNLLKTLIRRPKIGFIDILLAFLVTLIPLAGLIVANESDTPDPLIARAVLILGVALAIFNLLIVVIEALRPPRLKGSRGILGLYCGLLLILSSFGVPFVAAYFSVEAALPAATPVAQVATPVASGTPGLNSDQRQRAAQLFQAIGKVITDEITIEPSALDQSLQEGTPLAHIVKDHGGSVDRVISGISEVMKQNVRDAAARGDINVFQAALALSQMNNFTRLAVNGNLNMLGPTRDSNATRDPLFSFAAQVTAEVTGEPTASPTATPSPTRTPTLTRTPRPTATPSPTLFQFHTRTPTPTPTAVTPCVASVQYNLRLRSAPTTDSDTLTVIPYNSTVELYGQGPASASDAIWWFTTYQGQDGWLDGQYLLVSAACDRLPQREAP